MTITTIKISQEINFMGMPTWIGLEATLLPEESEKEGLRTLQKSITEYVKEENEKLPKPTWVPKPKPELSDATKQNIEAINNCNTIEELEDLWLLSKNNLVLAEAYKTKKQQLTDAQ